MLYLSPFSHNTSVTDDRQTPARVIGPTVKLN